MTHAHTHHHILGLDLGIPFIAMIETLSPRRLGSKVTKRFEKLPNFEKKPNQVPSQKNMSKLKLRTS